MSTATQMKTSTDIDEIVASGGALAASPIWKQIIADVLGRDLLVSNEPEASLRGAVLLALESTGKIDAIGDISTAGESTIGFHPKCRDIYKQARKRHLERYRSIEKK